MANTKPTQDLEEDEYNELYGGMPSGATGTPAIINTSPAAAPVAPPAPSAQPQGARFYPNDPSKVYIQNTYNGAPVVGANMGGNGLSSGAKFLESYVKTPFDQNGFRQAGSATEYDPSKDQMARSVVGGLVVPRQVGAPIQIDPKYGGGVGTVTNPFPSTMGAPAPSSTFATPPIRQPFAAAPATAAPATAAPATAAPATAAPATQAAPPKDRAEAFLEYARRPIGSNMGTSGGTLSRPDQEVQREADRLRATERAQSRFTQAEARRAGVRGGISRKAFGIGGGSPQDYVVEAGKSLRRRALEQEQATKAVADDEAQMAENAEIRKMLREQLRRDAEFIDAKKKRGGSQPQK